MIAKLGSPILGLDGKFLHHVLAAFPENLVDLWDDLLQLLLWHLIQRLKLRSGTYIKDIVHVLDEPPTLALLERIAFGEPYVAKRGDGSLVAEYQFILILKDDQVRLSDQSSDALLDLSLGLAWKLYDLFVSVLACEGILHEGEARALGLAQIGTQEKQADGKDKQQGLFHIHVAFIVSP